jgi:ATP-dependent DNA helicase DinG
LKAIDEQTNAKRSGTLSAATMLGPDGRFAQRLPSFRFRTAQQAMAAAVEAAFTQRHALICEAGTGTGKTYAYLVPALLSGKKVIVSTGTRNLQDQLFARDLPAVRSALSLPVTLALLKGRANYLCLQRLQLHLTSPRHQRHATELRIVERWSKRTRSGDVAELDAIGESSPVWPLVTSTAENCLGQDCPVFKDCHVAAARREALAADVVVVNHHLFLADMILREEGFGEVLPTAAAIIFDEAHQLPTVALQFFGTSVSSRQIQALIRDTETTAGKAFTHSRPLQDMARALEGLTLQLRASLGRDDQRASWDTGQIPTEVTDALTELGQGLTKFAEILTLAGAEHEALAGYADRAGALRKRLNSFLETDTDQQLVRWFETRKSTSGLHATPIDIAEAFSTRLKTYTPVLIFTSATLAAGGDFKHFENALGIEQAVTAHWPSPYDFARQALLYLPPISYDPHEPQYTRTVIAAMLPVLKASGGRAFLLFTSYRALHEAETLLQDATPYPLFVQGQAPRDILIQRFKSAGNAILLGTSSFWEGVDVPGAALSCVIIDKLPFAAPEDPLIKARIHKLKSQGRNAFRELQLPEALLALKQGIGRLLRGETDRGVLVLCDPRLRSKAYGRWFLDALPPIPQTTHLADVEAFFAEH